ncbi:MAG: hypothetical protein IT256_00890 [Chitinophagaceae bacterium]|nr:hypothetical protein [Chitinophagaceae bacterium]
MGNTYLQINNVRATLDTLRGKAIARQATGNVAVGVGGIDVNDPGQGLSLGGNGNGFGADLGAVYEYRPENLREERIPYMFKVSVALLDIGGIKYQTNPNQSAGYSINMPAGTNFDLANLDTNLKTAFDQYSMYFTKSAPISSYKVALPRTLQIGGDYRAVKNVFVAANMQLALINNESKAYNPRAVNALTITPRYEGKRVAAYLPINFSNLSKTRIGFGFRAGPLYAGSASLISMMISKSRQMDLYFGFRFGIKSKKEKAEKDS